jgi:pimeloyl-ACP methyl ester carboxylesterase
MKETLMNSSATPEGPGSVAGAPNLPDGFTGTFTSRYIDARGLRQHVVTGGGGPPLLLVHGWPQTWYAWRLVMPGLARDFSVVAPDQRGCGLSGKPEDGYDTGTLAGDLAALMNALGHRRFAVAGHDTGMWIGYALAADYPDRVARLAVAETPLPGVSPSPPLFASAHLNNALWHFAFNRLAAVNDQLVTGREQIYFGWQFAAKAARPLPGYAIRHYIDTLADPAALHASFAIYRALDATITQNQQRTAQRLALPVLGIGGEKSLREQVADTMKLAADDVQTLVIPGCGHHPPEEAPEETLAALRAFLALYRDEETTTHNPGHKRPRSSRTTRGARPAQPPGTHLTRADPRTSGITGNARS